MGVDDVAYDEDEEDEEDVAEEDEEEEEEDDDVVVAELEAAVACKLGSSVCMFVLNLFFMTLAGLLTSCW